jgi:hypothetical protein
MTNSAHATLRDSAPRRQRRQASRRNQHVSFLRVRAPLHFHPLPHRRLTWLHSARPCLRHLFIPLGRSPLPSPSMSTRRPLRGPQTSSRTSPNHLRCMRSKRQPLPKHIPPENIWASPRSLTVRHSSHHYFLKELASPAPQYSNLRCPCVRCRRCQTSSLLRRQYHLLSARALRWTASRTLALVSHTRIDSPLSR